MDEEAEHNKYENQQIKLWQKGHMFWVDSVWINMKQGEESCPTLSSQGGV